MSFDEFMQTKFAGALFCFIAFFTTLWFVWRSAEASGYMRDIQENPKNRDIHTYILDDGRMVRFLPGQERPVVIDAKKGTVLFVPVEPEQIKEASK